jgi:uncharacterized protein (DUF1499 family)
MKPVVWWLLLALPLILAGSALWLNRPPLLAEPGPWARLKLYLTSNVAQTADESPFPELRTPHFDQSCEQLHRQLIQTMRQLGWTTIGIYPDRVHAEVETPLLRFRDDVQAQLQRDPEGGCRLHLRSASRVGKADFAANQHHLMELLSALRAQGE